MEALQTTAPQVEEDLVHERHTSFSRQIFRRLRTDSSAVVGLFLLGLMVVLAIIAPLITHYGPDAINLTVLNQDPSGGHWFGTDYLGRDMWSRVVYGGRISLPAGLGVVAIAFGGGVPLGLIAGFVGGLIDDIIMRLVDILLAFPGILLAIGVVAILG